MAEIGALYKLDGSRQRRNQRQQPKGEFPFYIGDHTKRLSGPPVVGAPFDLFNFRDDGSYSHGFREEVYANHGQVNVMGAGGAVMKGTTAQQRTAFLTLVNNNINGLANALNQDMKNSNSGWDNFWVTNMGGNLNDLLNAIQHGLLITPVMIGSGATMTGAYRRNTYHTVGAVTAANNPGATGAMLDNGSPPVYYNDGTTIPSTYGGKPFLFARFTQPQGFNPPLAGWSSGMPNPYLTDRFTLDKYNLYMYSLQVGQDAKGFYGCWEWGANPQYFETNPFPPVWSASTQSADTELRQWYSDLMGSRNGIQQANGTALPVPLPVGAAKNSSMTGSLSLSSVLQEVGPLVAEATQAIASGSGVPTLNSLPTGTGTAGPPLPPQIPGSVPVVATAIPWVPIGIGAGVLVLLFGFFALKD